MNKVIKTLIVVYCSLLFVSCSEDTHINKSHDLNGDVESIISHTDSYEDGQVNPSNKVYIEYDENGHKKQEREYEPMGQLRFTIYGNNDIAIISEFFFMVGVYNISKGSVTLEVGFSGNWVIDKNKLGLIEKESYFTDNGLQGFVRYVYNDFGLLLNIKSFSREGILSKSVDFIYENETLISSTSIFKEHCDFPTKAINKFRNGLIVERLTFIPINSYDNKTDTFQYKYKYKDNNCIEIMNVYPTFLSFESKFYNKKNQIISKKDSSVYLSGNSPAHVEETKFEFNDTGGITKKTKITNGKINSIREYFFEKGKLTKSIFYGKEGIEYNRSYYSYDGNKTIEEINENGKIVGTEINEIDNKGNLVSEEQFNFDKSKFGKITYSYDYDYKGNWTKKTKHISSYKKDKSLDEISYRGISYY